MAGSLRFPLKKCVCHGEKIPCGRRIFVRFYLYMPETINDCGCFEKLHRDCLENRRRYRASSVHTSRTLSKIPGRFGVALFQVIKCRLAGEDAERIDSCIDAAGDVCVDAVTDDHGVLFGDAELFLKHSRS